MNHLRNVSPRGSFLHRKRAIVSTPNFPFSVFQSFTRRNLLEKKKGKGDEWTPHRRNATNQKTDSFLMPGDNLPSSTDGDGLSREGGNNGVGVGVFQRDRSVLAGKTLNFEDHVCAYRQKSTMEIVRAFCVLQICSINFVADNSMILMSSLRRFLPSSLFDALLHPTFYRQFVAGNDVSAITNTTNKLAAAGIRPMVAVPIEDDSIEGETEDRDNLRKSAERCETNLSRVLSCVVITRRVSANDNNNDNPDVNYRRPQLSSYLGWEMTNADVSANADADVDAIAGTNATGSGVMQLKVTALVPPAIVAKLNLALKDMNEDETTEYVRDFSSSQLPRRILQVLVDPLEVELLVDGLERLVQVASAASTAGVQLLVDAEYTYQNEAISFLTLLLMNQFNREVPLIWNTYQCYLKASAPSLQRDLNISQRLFFCHGAKIVRGAYMEKEKTLAAKKGMPSPVWETKRGTDDNYDKVVSLLLHRAAVGLTSHDFRDSFVFASHNEKSIEMAAEEIQRLKLPIEWNRGRSGVHFAQLYGMCDHVSYTMGQAGYPVFKSLPYGSVDEVMPYLSRRSSENKSVIQGARREKQLLRAELRERIRNVSFA